MKNKFKSYTFWLTLIGAVIILVNTLGTTFGFSVNEVAITSIATAVLGIFVTLGIVHKDSKSEQEKKQDETKDETKDEQTGEQDLENSSTKADEETKPSDTDKTDQAPQG